jgi:hypothetical protein
MIMRRVRDGSSYLYQVGSIQYFRVDGPAFEPVAEFGTLMEAAQLLNYINGGHALNLKL